ncbi:outer membrane beta-barrel protein [Sphingomonas sp. S2-65]|uniref:outer membrane beta-barrel protein n=1 Tax=Sphingomonas sp. S2-65 TaxID=2903960 RepID=UPI001F1FFD98|nr:outer membrane beta-barrel protein [Sphingomonas sp. S2-65]UYY57064.1 outer membrane beta-barrel protein [Sphingomonas sp. S2-65]
MQARVRQTPMATRRSFADTTPTRGIGWMTKNARLARVCSPRCLLLFSVAGFALSAPPASAQTEIDKRGESVTSRERARVEDNSHQVGAFLVSPQLSVTANYDDNIYATDTDRRGDVYLTVRPQLAVQSTWSSNALNFSGFFDRDIHAKYTSEDVSNYGAALDGRYDISRQTRLFAGVTASRNAERRGSLSSFAASAEPVRYTSATANLAAEQDLGNLRLRGEGRFRRVSYGDALLAGGVEIDQGFRDFDIFSGSLQARYDLNSLTSFILRGTLEERRYDLRPDDPGFDPLTQIDRSGSSTLLEAGIARELTELLYGTVRVGYLSFRYPDPKLNDVDAFSYFVDLKWNVTPLTTIVATAQRRVDETTSPVTAGNLRDEVGISLDHELLRSLIITADARIASINPSIADGVISVIDSSSDETEVGAGARYYIGRQLRVDARYNHRRRSSDNPLLRYVANRATVGVSFMF